MNINDYISTGVLEAYALGELSDQERSEVEKNLLHYPELRDEFSLIENTQEKLLMSMAVTPHATVKNKLFAKFKQDKQEVKVVSLVSTERREFIWRYAAAAAVTLALITSYLAYNFHEKWKSTQQDLTMLIAQNERVAKDYNQVNNRLDKIESDLKVIDNPAFKRVILKGTPNAPEALASVYWNEQTREVYLSVQSMKPCPKENNYQLWAMIDGKPVDAGVIEGTLEGGLLRMKAIGSGAALFAITVEPLGGKPVPTLETMQVAGPV